MRPPNAPNYVITKAGQPPFRLPDPFQPVPPKTGVVRGALASRFSGVKALTCVSQWSKDEKPRRLVGSERARTGSSPAFGTGPGNPRPARRRTTVATDASEHASEPSTDVRNPKNIGKPEMKKDQQSENNY